MTGGRRQVVYLSLGAPHLEYPAVAAALADRGVDARLVHLDNVDAVDWPGVDLVNVRMCRGYHRDPRFLDRIERLHERLQQLPGRAVPMANHIGLLRDAVDKGRYLRLLADDGIGLIPTRWVPRGSKLRVADVMDETGWDEVVIKPTVSSGSWRTIRVSRRGPSTADSHFVLAGVQRAAPYDRFAQDLVATHDVCVQRFMPSVLGRGELSFVFLGGRFSHAVRKTVGAQGGWWAHERLGGQNYPLDPTGREGEWAHHVHQALERRYGRLWFARVDALPDDDSTLRLLECELAIPRLLLPEGHAFGRYAETIARGLEQLASASPAQPAPPA